MYYLKDRQNKMRIKDHGEIKYGYKPIEFNSENANCGQINENIFIDDTSPYQKLLMREESRKNDLISQKKE